MKIFWLNECLTLKPESPAESEALDRLAHGLAALRGEFKL